MTHFLRSAIDIYRDDILWGAVVTIKNAVVAIT